MSKRAWSIAARIGVLGAGAAALAYAFVPRPVEVDVARVSRGMLRVTIDEEGLTSIRTRHVVSAPSAGQLERMEWRAGDRVIAGQTVLARIHPADPMLLDARSRMQAEAKLRSAEINVMRAGTLCAAARAAHEFAQTELTRKQQLFDQHAGLISRQEVESAALLERTRAEELKAAKYAEEISRVEKQAAADALLEPPAKSAASTLEVHTPVSGIVLRVLHRDAAMVAAGTPLVELGDPADLEVHVSVLTSDAVKIAPGSKVLIDGWGGSQTLEARVQQIEPAAVSRISTLGVAEQRVNVIVDLGGSSPSALPLGDNFSVRARIVEWEENDVLKAPLSGLVRQGDDWCVFRIESQRAVRRTVRIGERNGREAQVLEGLEKGDAVVAYPSDRIADGTRVVVRLDSSVQAVSFESDASP